LLRQAQVRTIGAPFSAAMSVVTSVRPRWNDRAMDTDGFWDLIEAARASAMEGKPFHEMLVDLLAARTEQEILDYQEKFDEATSDLMARRSSMAR
jgi:creatinine amidohydrolase/Fe(II)-dependent formamide hydrolase-like protein